MKKRMKQVNQKTECQQNNCNGNSQCNSSCCSIKKIRVSACSVFALIDGVRYEWYSGFNPLVSRERWVKSGDVRSIGNVPFAARVYGFFSGVGFLKKEVYWSPVCRSDQDFIREFKKNLFDC